MRVSSIAPLHAYGAGTGCDRWSKRISLRGWGSPGNGLYVKYYLQISPTCDVECFEPIYTKRWYLIILSRDLQSVVKLYLDGYLCAAGKPKE